jgi:dynein heavy chain
MLRCRRYGHISKLLSTLEPYVQLWTTINTFYNKYGTWMSGPFYKLNPEEVEAEVSDAFRWDAGRLQHCPN